MADYPGYPSAPYPPGGYPPGMPLPNYPPGYPTQYPTPYPPHYPPNYPPHYPPSHYPPPPEPSPSPSPPKDPSPPPQPPPGYYSHGPRNAAYYWVPCDASRGVYPTSVQGGFDQDGTQIYVGRAFHDGDWIPAKVIPEKNVAYIAYDGQEIAIYNYEVLCEQRFEWTPCSGGDIPPNAVEGGRTSDGERLYIGRAHHEGSQTVGKVHPSHSCCYIPFGGEEISYEDYEILVLR